MNTSTIGVFVRTRVALRPADSYAPIIPADRIILVPANFGEQLWRQGLVATVDAEITEGDRSALFPTARGGDCAAELSLLQEYGGYAFKLAEDRLLFPRLERAPDPLPALPVLRPFERDIPTDSPVPAPAPGEFSL